VDYEAKKTRKQKKRISVILMKIMNKKRKRNSNIQAPKSMMKMMRMTEMKWIPKNQETCYKTRCQRLSVQLKASFIGKA